MSNIFTKAHNYLNRIHKKRTYKHRCRKLKIEYKPGVVIGKNVQIWGEAKVHLSEGSRIADNCILWGNGDIYIGKRTSIGENSMIYANKNGGVVFGDDSCTAVNLYLIDSNHLTAKDKLISEQGFDSEKIVIGNDVWIGANVTMIKGSSLGNGCVVGACSLVNKKFGEYVIIGGVPAKVLKNRE